MKKITDFLQTKTNRKDLKITLKVLQEFRSHQSVNEFVMIPWIAWAKFDQLEEFLNHLVYKKPLRKDTKLYMKSTETDFK